MRKNEPYNHIRELRMKKNISQYDLAKRAGIHTSTLSTLETTGNQPSVETCEKLCDVLNVTPNELRGFDHPYNLADLFLPRDAGLYLCVFRHLPNMPFMYDVLLFNPKGKKWTVPGDSKATIDPELIKWWMDIPVPPVGY